MGLLTCNPHSATDLLNQQEQVTSPFNKYKKQASYSTSSEEELTVFWDEPGLHPKTGSRFQNTEADFRFGCYKDRISW